MGVVIYPKDEGQLVKWANRLFDEFDKKLHSTKEKFVHYEEMWRGNHWHNEGENKDKKPRPVTPLIHSTIENMLGDVMDFMPEPNLIGWEDGDKKGAELFEKAMKDLQGRDNYKRCYRWGNRRLFKYGMTITQIVMDPNAMGGLGDIAVKNLNPKNCLWDPEFEDIQRGRAFFTYVYEPLESVLRYYPELRGKENLESEAEADTYDNESHGAEDSKDAEGVKLMEVWYREVVVNTGEQGDEIANRKYKHILHYAKMVGDNVVYWTKLDPERAETGIYRHGLLPFVIGAAIPVDDQPLGLSIVQLYEGANKMVDKMDQMILINAIINGLQRVAYDPSRVNKDSVKDWRNQIIEVKGGDVRTAINHLESKPLNADAYNYRTATIDMIKKESGQNPYTRGEGGRGSDTARGILALQEAGLKRARLIIDEINDMYKDIQRQVLELMLQFYTPDRFLRYMDDAEPEEQTETIIEIDEMLSSAQSWKFDIRLTIQRKTMLSSAYYMEIAQTLISMGIPPEIAHKIMDYDGKDVVEAELQKMAEQQEIINEEAKARLEILEHLFPGMSTEEIMAAISQEQGQAPPPPGPVVNEDGSTTL